MKYQVGDYIKIKSWEQMVSEYPLDICGDITTDKYYSFVKEMRSLCGNTYKVIAVLDDAYMLDGAADWHFTDNMIETIENPRIRVEIKKYEDNWQEIKDAALFTIHKDNGKYPTPKWKHDILVAEHSPIRLGRFLVTIYNAPSFVIGHLVRHHIEFTPFVSSLRSDRTEYDNDKVPDRNTPNNIRFDMNFQTAINISRKRLCSCASKETREVWEMVKNEIAKVEPELANVMRRECVYRGFCPEMKCCGYCNTEAFKNELSEYRNTDKGFE